MSAQCSDKEYKKRTRKAKKKLQDQVLLKNMQNVDRKGGKMNTCWTGPYKITSYLGKGRFRLLNEETGKHIAKAFNRCRLKKLQGKVKKFPLQNKDKIHKIKVYVYIYSERERYGLN